MNNLVFPKAIILDMDGVLIDSEPLWKIAMMAQFAKHGMVLTENDCRATTGQRIDEVAAYWINQFEIKTISVLQLVKAIEQHLMTLIVSHGSAFEGCVDLLQYAKSKEISLGLATSSSEAIMQCVLNHLKLKSYFNVVCSAEHCKKAKPDPEVYHNAIKGLRFKPNECWAIEDSLNGLKAAISAGMQVVFMPEQNHSIDISGLQIAAVCENFKAVLHQLKSL
jgi:HAD superfamily hydrolase (TIGR01509 family)